ncbi:ABC transporter permease [Mycoplasma sp. NEAQ87857]|uniref:ABC transporter permease n=1 Tax=Mycoplasma sp. NEAQ87857 TaxID=2683967 RepID=UPI00351A9C31
MVAQFSDNPFARKALDLAGAAGADKATDNTAQIKIYFDESVRHHLTPAGLNFEEVKNTWTTLKVNPIIRLGYWFQNLFTNHANPFGEPYDPEILKNTGTSTIPQFFFSYLRFSAIITVPAFIISVIAGITLGIVAGYKRGTMFDAAINLFALFFVALPSFVIAPILISILLSANVPPVFLNPVDPNVLQTSGWGQIITSWLAPIFIIALGSLSGYITYTRNQVITVLTSNYVLIAKSKGLSTKEIFFKYVLRNISIPLAAVLIPSYIGLLTGGIVIETYWRVPGTSYVISQAFPNGEINIIMFNLVFFTSLSVFTTILVDVSFTFLDPRIKYGSKNPYSYLQFYKAHRSREKEFKEYIIGGGNEF